MPRSAATAPTDVDLYTSTVCRKSDRPCPQAVIRKSNYGVNKSVLVPIMQYARQRGHEKRIQPAIVQTQCPRLWRADAGNSS